MTLKCWIEDNIGECGCCSFKGKAIEGFTVIGTCVGCKYWEFDLGFCSSRNELDWEENDGCIRWEAK